MRCPRCAHDVAEGARFCPFCGTPFAAGAETRVDAPPPAPPPVQPPTTAAPAPPVYAPPPAYAQPQPGYAQPYQPAAPPPQWIAETKDAWSRVGNQTLGVALGLSGGAILLSLIGVLLASTSSYYSSSAYHGGAVARAGLVLSFVALVAFGLGRVDSGIWPTGRDLKIAQILGLAAVGVALVGLIFGYASTPARAAIAGTSWESFATVVAVVAFGWSILTRPFDPDRARKLGIACGAGALLFTLVGLVVGLSNTSDVLRSPAWFGLAEVGAFLAAAAVLGRRTSA
jgi:hypothetical protein